jgi:periodic tryptophan protein 1
MTSMITAAQWVPRGFAAPFPEKYALDEAEYERIASLAKLQLDDAEEDLKEAQEEEKEQGKPDGNGDEAMETELPKKSKKFKKTKVKYVSLTRNGLSLSNLCTY